MAASASSVSGGMRPERRWRRHPVLLVVLVALVVLVLVRSLVLQAFTVPTGSMEPTIEPGDRVLVNRLVGAADLHRGDVVVFDGRRAFLGESRGGPLTRLGRSVVDALSLGSSTDYVKRVVGLPGDRVTCCDAGGSLVVNGVAVTEPYLHPGDAASDVPFDVVVAPRSLWVMGDHRSVSADSRSYLGRPGGGMVPQDDVVGQVTMRYWPLGRLGSLGAPGPLSTVPEPEAGP